MTTPISDEVSAVPLASTRFSPQLLPATIAVGAILLFAERIFAQYSLPLWLDETWTAAISGQANWNGFWRQAWLDCNPPLYYAVMKLWMPIVGTSNFALRLPSLVFVIAAAVLPAIWKISGLTPQARLTWAALLFSWWPGLLIAVDARGYGLLLLISTGQAIAYTRIMQTPSVSRVLCWTSLAALAVLTHYYAATIVAVQGLIFLYVHRQRAITTWPALLPFVPVFGIMAYHAPRLADYARPDVAWYLPVSIYSLSDFIGYVTGVQTAQIGVVMAIGIAMLWWLIRTGSQPVRDEELALDPAIGWTAIAGVVSVAITVGLAMLKPTLTDRYLTPAAPSILLGIVLCVRQIHGTHAAYAALATIFWLGAVTPFTLKERLSDRAAYGYERGSDFLLAARPDHLVFAWDHPATKIMARDSLDRIGGFFLRRAGTSVTVTPITFALDDMPSARLLATATGSRPAILWLYDSGHGSVAGRDGFAIMRQPGWRCRHSRRGRTGVLACAPSRLFAS
jgi:hypothetical protein